MNERRVRVDRVTTRLLEVGDDSAGEAVVFVHGNPGSADDWPGLMQHAAAVAPRAVAPDMPGFGTSRTPWSWRTNVAHYGRWLGQLFDQVGIARVHLVLHDFGGGFGLAWAARNGERLASLTLIDTGVLRDYEWHRAASIWRTPGKGELAQLLLKEDRFKHAVARSEPRGLPDGFLDGMWRHYDWRTRWTVLELYRATPPGFGEPFVERFRALDPPTLVVWGAEDAYVPAGQAHRQRESFPSADVHVLDDCGHWPFIDEPDRVGALLRDHVAGHLGSGA